MEEPNLTQEEVGFLRNIIGRLGSQFASVHTEQGQCQANEALAAGEAALEMEVKESQNSSRQQRDSRHSSEQQDPQQSSEQLDSQHSSAEEYATTDTFLVSELLKKKKKNTKSTREQAEMSVSSFKVLASCSINLGCS